MKDFNLEKELEAMTNRGLCPALIYDDMGHWYLATEGVQPMESKVSVTTFFIDDKKGWKKTPRKAVEYFLKKKEG